MKKLIRKIIEWSFKEEKKKYLDSLTEEELLTEMVILVQNQDEDMLKLYWTAVELHLRLKLNLDVPKDLTDYYCNNYHEYNLILNEK